MLYYLKPNTIANVTKYCLALIVVLLSACKEKDDLTKNDGHQRPYKKSITLTMGAEKIISLDSLTSTDRVRFHHGFNSVTKKEELWLLDILGQSLQRFDWTTGKMEKKVRLQREGSNSVGVADQFYVVSPDSIYILSSTTFRLSLINGNGNVINYFSLINGNSSKMKLGVGVQPLPKESNPLGVIDEYIFVGGYPFADRWKSNFYTDGYIGLKIDCKSKDVVPIMKLPDYFTQRYEAGFILCGQHISGIGQCYNPERKIIVVNIPTESHIFEVTPANPLSIKQHYAGTEEFDKIQLASKNLKDMQKEFEYYTETPEYDAIKYDPFRKQYIRFLYVPNPDKKNEFDGKPWVKISLIILNETFEKIGEYRLKEDFFRVSSVVFTTEGMYLKKYTNVESEIAFVKFTFTPVK